MTDIRWYKGKYKVEILKKSEGNYLVRALTLVPKVKKFRAKNIDSLEDIAWLVGQEFVTVPRLLWRHPKK